MHLRPRRTRRTARRLAGGALWALILLACVAGLPGGLPTASPSPTTGLQSQAGEATPSAAELAAEEAAAHQAMLAGRAAARNVASDRAAARRADKGPGVTAPALVIPVGTDAGIPSMALRAYQRATAWAAGYDPGCHLAWPVLAGIGRIESDHGLHFGGAARFGVNGDTFPVILGPELNGNGIAAIPDTDHGRLDLDPVWDRAVGPMQFLPSTWRGLGRDGNGDGVASPDNFFDAATSAAAYLCLEGGDLSQPGPLRQAVFAYNHSQPYVDAVLGWAAFYGQHGLAAPNPPGTGPGPGPGSSTTAPGPGTAGGTTTTVAQTTTSLATTLGPTTTTMATTTTHRRHRHQTTTTAPCVSTTTGPTTGPTTTTAASSSTTASTTTSTTTTTLPPTSGSTTTSATTTTLPPCK